MQGSSLKFGKMKRGSDRDSSPMSKRSRSSIGRYDDSSDERMTPERDRRGSRGPSRGRSPGPSPGRGRYPADNPSHRDDYRPRGPPDRPLAYKVLCISAIHPKVSDEVVRETMYREYKKFCDVSVKVVHEPDERVAYVYFRSFDDARAAKHSRPRINIADKPAIIEAVCESGNRNSGDPYRARPRSMSPEYGRYYRSRSPVMGADRHRPDDDRYDRGYGPPPPGPPHRDFRDGPMIPHHEFHRGPPPHRGPPRGLPGPPGHHYGPPHHGGGGGGGGFKHFDRPDGTKKDKFPNYLHHVPPEEDPLATRTLFAGNLEINITDEELRRIFGRYGIVEDIDIKRPAPGTGNAYAFVRYHNLDMAHRAKVELSGQYIGKFQCKIGYGKVNPTTRVWIGGLGPWTAVAQLEREFDRFGAIKKIDYVKGDNHAYILYDSIDAAQAAVQEMRGFPLGGPDRRLRVDFSEIPQPYGNKQRGPMQDDLIPGDYRGRPLRDDWVERGGFDLWGEAEYSYGPPRVFRGRGGGHWDHRGGRGGFRGGFHGDAFRDEEWIAKRPPGEGEFDVPPRQVRRSHTPEPGEERSGSRSPSERRHSIESDSVSDKSDSRRNGVLNNARTLVEVARKCDVVWQGGLILKNSLFPTKLHLTDGELEIVDSLLKEDGKPQLRITQRLRLDQPKLDDVSKRITSSSSHALFLSLPGSSSSVTIEDPSIQSRPLRNLVSYLKQKEAAGVISLHNKETEATGVLYAFPPCQFSTDLLKRTIPNLSEEGMKEDHLVVVVVRGAGA